MIRQAAILACALLAGCASYSGSGLRPGDDGSQVRAVMGAPDETWQEADGGATWSYPRGPMGRETFMARLGPDGKLIGITPVLNDATFDRIVGRKTTEAEVRRRLGRPAEIWFLPRQHETVWRYRYWHLAEPWVFEVGIDDQGVVTDTFRRPEYTTNEVMSK